MDRTKAPDAFDFFLDTKDHGKRQRHQLENAQKLGNTRFEAGMEQLPGHR